MATKQLVLASSLLGSYLLYLRLQKTPDTYVKLPSVDVLSCVQLVEECEPHLTKEDQQEYLQKLDREYANISKALGECIQRNNVEYITYALRIIGALPRFWFITGRQQEGFGIARFFLEKCNNYVVSSFTAAKFLQALGTLAHATGSFDDAEKYFTDALSCYQKLGNNEINCAIVANQIGLCCRERGDYDRANEMHTFALQIFTSHNNQWGIGLAENNIGVVAREKGEWDKALQHFTKTLQVREAIGDKLGIASALGNLGAVAYAQSDYGSARSFHEQCLAIRRGLNDSWGVSGALANIGLVACEQGDYASSFECLSEAIKSFSKISDKLGMCECLEGFACLFARQGKWQQSAVLFGAARELRKSIHTHTPLSRKGHHDKYLGQLLQHFTQEELENLQLQGAKMNFMEAINFALL